MPYVTNSFAIMATTVDIELHGTVDSLDINNVCLHAYPGADLCGTFDTTRATSGGFVELIGDNTFFSFGVVFKATIGN